MSRRPPAAPPTASDDAFAVAVLAARRARLAAPPEVQQTATATLIEVRSSAGAFGFWASEVAQVLDGRELRTARAATPPWCGVVAWRSRLLPTLDGGPLLGGVDADGFAAVLVLRQRTPLALAVPGTVSVRGVDAGTAVAHGGPRPWLSLRLPPDTIVVDLTRLAAHVRPQEDAP